ncbi:hypothetical protein PQX77_015345 [Marasmius sp. AFHP31]|nr:hypothetical protein PQX77_015345 [Marasmius sp. AFHP31]
MPFHLSPKATPYRKHLLTAFGTSSLPLRRPSTTLSSLPLELLHLILYFCVNDVSGTVQYLPHGLVCKQWNEISRRLFLEAYVFDLRTYDDDADYRTNRYAMFQLVRPVKTARIRVPHLAVRITCGDIYEDVLPWRWFWDNGVLLDNSGDAAPFYSCVPPEDEIMFDSDSESRQSTDSDSSSDTEGLSDGHDRVESGHGEEGSEEDGAADDDESEASSDQEEPYSWTTAILKRVNPCSTRTLIITLEDYKWHVQNCLPLFVAISQHFATSSLVTLELRLELEPIGGIVHVECLARARIDIGTLPKSDPFSTVTAYSEATSWRHDEIFLRMDNAKGSALFLCLSNRVESLYISLLPRSSSGAVACDLKNFTQLTHMIWYIPCQPFNNERDETEETFGGIFEWITDAMKTIPNPANLEHLTLILPQYALQLEATRSFIRSYLTNELFPKLGVDIVVPADAERMERAQTIIQKLRNVVGGQFEVSVILGGHDTAYNVMEQRLELLKDPPSWVLADRSESTDI